MEYEFGRNARVHARKTHNKEENISKLLEIYEELLQGKVTNHDKAFEKKIKTKQSDFCDVSKMAENRQ